MNLVIGKSGNRVIDWVIERTRARRGGGRLPNEPINYPIPRLPDYPIRASLSGFTLIELLIVVTLITLLATIGMTQYRTSVIHAREATLKEDLFRLRDAIDQYYADKGKYPSTLDELVSDGYVRKLPEDPFTKSNTSWTTVAALCSARILSAPTRAFRSSSGESMTMIGRSSSANSNPTEL